VLLAARRARSADRARRIAERPEALEDGFPHLGIGAQILPDLKVGKMRLMASPRKMPSMAGWGSRSPATRKSGEGGTLMTEIKPDFEREGLRVRYRARRSTRESASRCSRPAASGSPSSASRAHGGFGAGLARGAARPAKARQHGKYDAPDRARRVIRGETVHFRHRRERIGLGPRAGAVGQRLPGGERHPHHRHEEQAQARAAQGAGTAPRCGGDGTRKNIAKSPK